MSEEPVVTGQNEGGSAEPPSTPQQTNQPDTGKQAMSLGGMLLRFVPQSPAAAIQPKSVPLPPGSDYPDRPDRPLINFLSGFLSLIAFLASVIAAVFVYFERQIVAPGPLDADKIVIVHGSSADVVDQLEREGVIEKGFLLNLYWQATGKAQQIKGGEYLFRRQASLVQVTDTLVEGKAVLHSLTIPEGKTSVEILELVRSNPDLVGDIRDIPKEGALLPETYKFARGMTRTALLDRMAQDQAKLLREIWAKRAPDLPISSPQELVILASVVEKETGKADERPRVAAVFVNRLRSRMRLESDPTVIYGLVGGKGALGRSLTRADLLSQNAYNTYVIPGLPAGPITNPGRAALEAVANPSRTKEFYFVADGTNGHVFAETFEQHQRNVQKWRQIEAEASAATTAPIQTQPQAPSVPEPKIIPVPDAPVVSVQPSSPPASTTAKPKPAKKKVPQAPVEAPD